jgi:hypothetical protein
VPPLLSGVLTIGPDHPFAAARRSTCPRIGPSLALRARTEPLSHGRGSDRRACHWQHDGSAVNVPGARADKPPVAPNTGRWLLYRALAGASGSDRTAFSRARFGSARAARRRYGRASAGRHTRCLVALLPGCLVALPTAAWGAGSHNRREAQAATFVASLPWCLVASLPSSWPREGAGRYTSAGRTSVTLAGASGSDFRSLTRRGSGQPPTRSAMPRPE